MMNSCIKVSALLVGFLCLLTSCVADRAEQTKVIAHRGYWKCEGSAQNSIRSLERAAEIGAYGSEFDVHLTADGVLVVYHDNEIEGKNIQSSTYADLKDLTLSNGETLPTLENYLERAKSLDKLHLVFELKAHQTPERNREAAEASVNLVKKMGLEDRTDYISFNLDACKAFIRLCPDSKVFYLNGELSPKELKALGFAGLDYHYNVLREHSDWARECQELGLQVNVWTVNEEPLMEEMIAWGANYLTTDHPEEALALINKPNK